MILLVWGTTMLLFAALLYVGYDAVRKDEIRQTKEVSQTLTELHAAQYSRFFVSVSHIPEIEAIYLESGPTIPSPAAQKSFLLQLVKLNSSIYGSCMAFEPGVVIPGRKYYMPYAYHRHGSPDFMLLGSREYDYFNMDWYRRPKATGKAMWLEPYFDRGGGDVVMTTYSVPVFRQGDFIGVCTVDISLLELTNTFRRIKILQSGYGFIVSGQGMLLSYPDQRQVLTGNIRSLNPKLADRMATGKPFIMITRDPLRGKPAWIVSSPIQETGFSLALVYPEKEVLARIVAFQKNALLLGTVGLLLLLLLVLYVSNSVTRPVTELVESVKRIARGELDRTPPVRTRTEEVLTLQQAFNQMVDDLKTHIEQLRSITAEKQRIESELSIARQIQLSAIPCKFPPFPYRPELDLFAKTLPAREVGGDFYDFFLIDRNRLGFVIGDASGKGMPAAIFMSVGRAFLKAIALQGLEPGQCLAQVNDLLCREDSSGMFITLFFGILDTTSGEVLYCNGGHNPPYQARSGGGWKAIEQLGGPALGVIPGAKYQASQINIEEGIFLYSDGVTEAWNGQGDMFDTDNLMKALGEQSGFSPQKAVGQVLEAVERFSSGQPQSDDITVLAIRLERDGAVTLPGQDRKAK